MITENLFHNPARLRQQSVRQGCKGQLRSQGLNMNFLHRLGDKCGVDLRPVLPGRSTNTRRRAKRNPFEGLGYQRYDQLQAKCLQEGLLFEDPEFEAVPESIYFSNRSSRPMVWLRPGVSSPLSSRTSSLSSCLSFIAGWFVGFVCEHHIMRGSGSVVDVVGVLW